MTDRLRFQSIVGIGCESWLLLEVAVLAAFLALIRSAPKRIEDRNERLHLLVPAEWPSSKNGALESIFAILKKDQPSSSSDQSGSKLAIGVS